MSSNKPLSKHFASDNYAGVHPEILEALTRVAANHEVAYGEDSETARFAEIVQKLFGEDAKGYPVFNGTAANVLALQTLVPRYGAVICADTAHINVDEGGAPERVAGLKLLPVPHENGKITPELIAREAWGYGDVHRAQPLAVSISQATELGTVYSRDEIKEIVDFAHTQGMKVHVDGSRIANAAAHLSLNLREFTTDLGVDAVSLGATKNGALGAEAVILRDAKTNEIEYLRKMNLQLASKMRFLSAQLNTLYEGELWLRSAAHANEMAKRLRAGIDHLSAASKNEVYATRPSESNAVFVRLPEAIAQRALEVFRFYEWPASKNEYRLMCSFDTTPEEVDALLALLRG